MSHEELEQKFRIFEKQIIQIQEQLRAVEQAVLDLSQINLGLDELVGKTNEEIMAPIGKGIFVKAKLISEELTVDVGGGSLVKKNIPDTKKMIQEQIQKLNGMKIELEGGLNKINDELTQTMIQGQKKEGECECGDDCKCEEEDNCGCGHEH